MSKRTTTCPLMIVLTDKTTGKWRAHSFEKNERLAKKAANNARKFHPDCDVTIESNPQYDGVGNVKPS